MNWSSSPSKGCNVRLPGHRKISGINYTPSKEEYEQVYFSSQKQFGHTWEGTCSRHTVRETLIKCVIQEKCILACVELSLMNTCHCGISNILIAVVSQMLDQNFKIIFSPFSPKLEGLIVSGSNHALPHRANGNGLDIRPWGSSIRVPLQDEPKNSPCWIRMRNKNELSLFLTFISSFYSEMLSNSLEIKN